MLAVRRQATLAVMAGARSGPSFPPRMRGGKLNQRQGALMSDSGTTLHDAME